MELTDVIRVWGGLVAVVVVAASVAQRIGQARRDARIRDSFRSAAPASALLGAGELLLPHDATPATIARPYCPVLLGVALIAGLFLAYRGVQYAQCRSSCSADCAAEAQRVNPFGFGFRNDIGRALCEGRVESCMATCAFP